MTTNYCGHYLKYAHSYGFPTRNLPIRLTKNKFWFQFQPACRSRQTAKGLPRLNLLGCVSYVTHLYVYMVYCYTYCFLLIAWFIEKASQSYNTTRIAHFGALVANGPLPSTVTSPMTKQAITKGMLIDLDHLGLSANSFKERLNALLDELGVPSHGKGRQKWVANAAGIRELAAGNWFRGKTPRKSNLERMASYICQQYELPLVPSEIVDYLCNARSAINVNAELSLIGLTGPEQAQVQIVVSRAMDQSDLNPLDEKNLLLWTKVVLRMGRYYMNRQSRGKLPSEDRLVDTAAAFLHLAQEDAI